MTEPRDEFDRSLRDRIGAAEARVRVSSAPPNGRGAVPAAARWLRPALVLATAAVAVVLAVLVIGQLPDRTVGDATPSPPTAGVSASARNGDFILTLSSPRSTWTTEDAIEITATLSYDGDEPQVEIGAGGGPVVFSLVQLEGGNAVLGGGQDLPCLRYQLGPDAPLVWPFQKAGGINDEPPFDRAFFNDPDLHLPPGRWAVRAVLEYGHPDCGNWQELEVSIQLDVLEAAGSPGPSAVATEPPVSSAPPSPAAFEIAMRSGDEDTIRYVHDMVMHGGQLVAAVNTLHASFVPATGPDARYSAEIHVRPKDGAWRRLDTGSTFADTRIAEMLSSPDGLLIVYGYTENYQEGLAGRTRVWTSTDADQWTEIAVPPGIDAFAAFAEGRHGFLAAVNEADQNAGIDSVSLYWSADALTWERTHAASVEGTLALYAAGAGDEGFVVVGRRDDENGDRAFSLASSDGQSWIESPNGEFGDEFATAVAPLGGDWIAAAPARDGSMSVWLSADGLNWTQSATIQDPGGFTLPDGEESLFGNPSHLVSASGIRLFLSAALAAEGVDTRPRAVWTSADGRRWDLLNLGGDAEIRAAIIAHGTDVLGGRLGDQDGDAVIWQVDDHWFD